MFIPHINFLKKTKVKISFDSINEAKCNNSSSNLGTAYYNCYDLQDHNSMLFNYDARKQALYSMIFTSYKSNTYESAEKRVS